MTSNQRDKYIRIGKKLVFAFAYAKTKGVKGSYRPLEIAMDMLFTYLTQDNIRYIINWVDKHNREFEDYDFYKACDEMIEEIKQLPEIRILNKYIALSANNMLE